MKTRNELILNLSKIINEYSEDMESEKTKEITDIMLESYAKKGLPIRTVGLVFKGEKTFLNLSEVELGIWCMNLYKVIKNELLNIEDYFTEKEIYEIKTYVNNDDLDKPIDKITLHDVTKKIIKGKVYYIVPFVTYYQIYQVTNSSLITYNFETQRDAKLTKYQGRIIKQENVNLASVEEISELVSEDEQPISMITWNIRQSKYVRECIFYNEEHRTLEIQPSLVKEVFIDNIDGYHRTLGCQKGVLKAINKNRTLNGGFVLQVTNYVPEECQNYIHVQNKQNAITREQMEAFVKDEFNEFVKSLNYYESKSKNVLYDKICNTLEEVNLGEKYVTVGILHDGFKLTGEKFDKPFVNETIFKEHFIEMFNTILGYYQYKYDNDKQLREETIALEPNVFVGYISIAKELLNKENKKQVLLRLLQENKIDLDRNAYDWENLDIYKKSPRSYKKIYDYFKNLIKEEIK